MPMKKKPYYFNSGTKTLHIWGCCKDSKASIIPDNELFRCENEVAQQWGLTYKWCEKCLEWRENTITEMVNRQEDEMK